MITNHIVRHPVVVQQAASRYSDFQLRIADRITAFAGSMLLSTCTSPCSPGGCSFSNAARGRR